MVNKNFGRAWQKISESWPRPHRGGRRCKLVGDKLGVWA